jgi:putative transposase
LLLEARRAAGRLPYPSAGVLDSQSAKTSSVGGERGFDAAKKVKGRKRQILVDSVGHLWHVFIHPADQRDVVGAKRLISALPPMLKLRLFKLWADYGYRGPFTNWCRRTFHCDVEIVKPPRYQTSFHPLKRRWVVERTFAWLSNFRRLTKEYEKLPRHSEGFIYLASIRRTLALLTA